MSYGNEFVDEEEELNALLAKRRAELEKLLRRQEEERERAAQEEMARETILRSILTDEARERLARIKLARPEFARIIEDQLILLARSGRITEPITDDQLKEFLKKLTSRRREGAITFKRKGGL
ncbi:MAG: DNA-binding protein [Candidatus Njordarchaeales archaeon]